MSDTYYYSLGTAVAFMAGADVKRLLAAHSGGAAPAYQPPSSRTSSDRLFSERSGVFCCRFAQVVVSRAPTLVLRQCVLSHREGKRAGSRWKKLGPRVLHSALAVVCGRPRALTVRLLCAWHMSHGGCMCMVAVCAWWMPMPAGNVLPAGTLSRPRLRAGSVRPEQVENCSLQGAPR